MLFILFEKKGGIGKARPDNSFVACDHPRRFLADQVADGDEVRQDIALAVFQGEAFLVVFHRRNQRFFWHVEEGLVEGAGQGHRPFDQCGDLIEQVLVDDNPGIVLAALLLQLRANFFPALGEIRQNKTGFSEGGNVVRR